MMLKDCSFSTERLIAKEWHSHINDDADSPSLASIVCKLLTPAVTASLPEPWQCDYTTEKATAWIKDRDEEGVTLLVFDRSANTPIGLMMLFESDENQQGKTIRLGYLLSEKVWGKGMATELIGGFIKWCQSGDIHSVVAGVERSNVASQRVLEKVGFVPQGSGDDHPQLFYEHHLATSER